MADQEKIAATKAKEPGNTKSAPEQGHLGVGSRAEAVVSGEADKSEIFIPVSEFVWLFPEEIEVVNHPTFQRLGRIYQLGQSYVVYRGATHKRLEHALGALAVVDKMIGTLENATERSKRKQAAGNANHRSPALGLSLSQNEKRFVRLGALLHDIGHIAAGHTVEDELCLLGKHDQDARITMLFDGDDWKDVQGRTLAVCIDAQFQRYVPEELRRKEIKASEIVRMLIRKPPKVSADAFSKAQKALDESGEIRLEVCRDMIGNTICADLLDYLHRDWYHIGKPRPFDERLLQYMEIRAEPTVASAQVAPRRKSSDRFVVSLGNRPRIRSDAVSAILELLEWRYQLAESVLFHRTKLSAAAMLDRALYALWGAEGDPAKLERFLLPLSDEEMLTACISSADHLENDRGRLAKKLLSRLNNWQLFTNLATWFYDDLTERIYNRVHRLYGGADQEGGIKPADCRWQALEHLETDFKLSPGSLAMYCPPEEMNAKIAQVKIAVDDEVDTFAQYENNHDNALSGGHLKAQLHRFKRLWRVHFFIDHIEKERLREQGLLSLLLQAIQKLVLQDLIVGEESLDAARALATSIAGSPNSPWHGYEVSREAAAGYLRRQAGGADPTCYPSGAPTLASLLKRRGDTQ